MVLADLLCFFAPATTASDLRPIDRFFESLALDRAERATAILLAGRGHDGMVALAATDAGRDLRADPAVRRAGVLAPGEKRA
jgi:hypothetical protein